jgi:hypothetical protein
MYAKAIIPKRPGAEGSAYQSFLGLRGGEAVKVNFR